MKKKNQSTLVYINDTPRQKEEGREDRQKKYSIFLPIEK
jgi:hypothetical protein